jgi:hypothetical protein
MGDLLQPAAEGALPIMMAGGARGRCMRVPGRGFRPAIRSWRRPEPGRRDAGGGDVGAGVGRAPLRRARLPVRSYSTPQEKAKALQPARWA